MVHKTISIQYDPTRTERLLIEFMTKEAKEVYNKTIFCFQFFDMFKDRIYKDLYDFILTFIKKFNAVNLDIVTIVNDEFDRLIETYYKYYLEIRNQLITNNNIMYKYIIEEISNSNVVITNNNYEIYYEDFKEDLEEIIKPDKETRFDIFDNILTNILKSIYTKNFYHVKYGLLNHDILRIKSETFINQVKRNQFLFKDKKINWKSKIEKDFLQFKRCCNITNFLLSDQRILCKIVMRFLSDKLPSEVKHDIIGKAWTTITSYFGLKKNGYKCNFPKYLPYDAYYNVIFNTNSRKEVTFNNKKFIRLTLGSYISKNYAIITENPNLICINNDEETIYKKYIDSDYLNTYVSNNKFKSPSKGYMVNNKYISKKNRQIIDTYYMYVPFPNINRNKSEETRYPKYKNLSFVEIVPRYDGTHFNINIVYDNGLKKVKTESEDNPGRSTVKCEESVSFDLGMINLITIYDPTDTCYIIKGSKLIRINDEFNRRISKLQSKLKTKYGLNTSKKLRKLFLKRENQINHCFNMIVKEIYNLYKNKKKIIIGINKNWKKGINLGRKTNRRFYQIPFMKLIHKLKDKFNRTEEIVVTREESYTSKCDALSFEEICRHDEYSGERIKRGLYRSANGRLINADINGAINIMRKYNKNHGIPMGDRIEGNKIFNPVQIKY